MGVFLNAFIRHADVVKMANLAQLVNVIAPIFTNKQGLYLQTIYFPIAEYAKQRGNQSLDVRVDSPQYKPDTGRALGYLDVSATYDPKTRQVFVNVLNRSEKTDITARIDNVAGAPVGAGERLGAEPPGPQGHAHLRQGHGRAAGDAQREREGQRERLRLHLPQALADDPDLVRSGRVDERGGAMSPLCGVAVSWKGWASRGPRSRPDPG